jgi:transcriptional regulator with XRE-family HTH domain
MIKMKIGHKLIAARTTRNLSQAEMSDFLGIATTTYARLERNETSIDIEELMRIAEKLQMPIQDFLPETITINSNNQHGNIGLVIGNIYYYTDKDSIIKDLEHRLELKEQETKYLQEIIELQKAQNK